MSLLDPFCIHSLSFWVGVMSFQQVMLPNLAKNVVSHAGTWLLNGVLAKSWLLDLREEILAPRQPLPSLLQVITKAPRNTAMCNSGTMEQQMWGRQSNLDSFLPQLLIFTICHLVGSPSAFAHLPSNCLWASWDLIQHSVANFKFIFAFLAFNCLFYGILLLLGIWNSNLN